LKKEIKIGLTVIIGIVLLYVCVTWVKSLHLFAVNRSQVQIRFDDLAGLKEGDPVAVFGYPCGNVERIELSRTGAIVTVSIDNKVQLYSDATADIRVKELMGSKQVWIVPGNASELLGDKIIKGSTSLDFASAMSKAGEFMARFEAHEIDSFLRNISSVAAVVARLGDEMDSVDTGVLFSNMESASGSLRQILDDAEKRGLVASLDQTLSQVDGLAQQAGNTMKNVDSLTRRLQNSTLPVTESALTQVNRMLVDSEAMVNDLQGLIKQLKDPNTVAGKLLQDPEMYRQLDETLDNLNLTLEHIRTKKIFVTMTLSKQQKVFSEEPVEVNGQKVKKP
jgi:phospholipid/cholesterol/gamma-HCH transport system substrate-binding protein